MLDVMMTQMKESKHVVKPINQ